jgi:hypothetical protein
MQTNPYKDPESPLEPPPARRLGVWSRVLWFALGFFVSWIMWSVIDNRAYAPRDYTQGVPEDFRDGQPEWMKNAKGRHVGQFTIIAANDPQKASARVFPTPPHRGPEVAYEDTDSDGRIDSLLVCDAKHRTFEFVVVDGSFQSYNYSPDLFAKDSVTFFDGDMDGRFDYRAGPGRRWAMLVNSQWHDLFPEGGFKGYVDVDGARIPAEYVNGMWRIVQ